MGSPRHGLASVALNESIYVMGGFDGSSVLDTVEKYYPATDHWIHVVIEEVIRRLSSADEKVYANILASHGGLTSRSVDGVSETLENMQQLPTNVRLFIIATRGYQHQGVRSVTGYEEVPIKYLKVLREGIEEENNGTNPFHDDHGCLTELGEKTLANMMIVMGRGKTYEEYYGAEFPETFGKEPWNVFQNKGAYADGKSWEWSAPFLMLKIYNSEYNEQKFTIDTQERKERFGVLFQYKDKGNIKNIFLHLGYLLDFHKSYAITLTNILEALNPLFTDQRTKNLKFNFTHMSCRTDYSDPGSLTREFSNQSEKTSIHCFVKKYFKTLNEENKRNLIDKLTRNFDTIYEFFNKLKEKGKYDEFLYLLKEIISDSVAGLTTEFDEDHLFRFILEEASVRSFRVITEEEETRLAEEEQRKIEELSSRFPGIERVVVDSILESSEGNFDTAVEFIKEHQRARGRQAGGKKIKKRIKSKKKRKTKRIKSKRRKTKRRVKNKKYFILYK